MYRNKATYLAIGVTIEGCKEVFGLWIAQTVISSSLVTDFCSVIEYVLLKTEWEKGFEILPALG